MCSQSEAAANPQAVTQPSPARSLRLGVLKTHGAPAASAPGGLHRQLLLTPDGSLAQGAQLRLKCTLYTQAENAF